MNRDLLEKPFAPEQIKRRQGMNGDVLDYIEGCTVIQRLNECFNAEWIFEVQEHRVYDDEVVVLGKLRHKECQRVNLANPGSPDPGRIIPSSRWEMI